jgi:hypothetical protein
MSTTRSSLFASIAVAALAVTGTGLIASEAAATPLCHRLFGGAFGGAGFSPRHASVAPSYRQRVAAHKPVHAPPPPKAVVAAPPPKPVVVASAPVKATLRKPIATPEPVKLSSTVGAANITQDAGTVATHVNSCLAKQYLDTGAVMFKDTCTNEWAINSTTVTAPPGVSASRCLSKENHPDGVVMFRDTCTNEWAMNTSEQIAEAPATR